MSKVRIEFGLDAATGELDQSAPFFVRAEDERRCGLYCDEPTVIEQMLPGEQAAWFEAEWTDEGWRFGKRITHA